MQNGENIADAVPGYLSGPYLPLTGTAADLGHCPPGAEVLLREQPSLFFFFPGGPRVLVMLCEADPNKGGADGIWPLPPSSGAAPWARTSAETMREEPVGGVRLSLE